MDSPVPAPAPRDRSEAEMTAWDAIWPLLSRVDPALIQQHWPTSEPRSFLQMLHAYDPTQAQRLERTYQLVQRFQHVPMVAVAGLINSGKSALVASFLSGASRARVLRGRQSSQGSQRFCLWLPRQWQADQVFYDDLLTGPSNKFFDILVMTLKFRPGFRLGKLPVHRGTIGVSLLPPGFHFVS